MPRDGGVVKAGEFAVSEASNVALDHVGTLIECSHERCQGVVRMARFRTATVSNYTHGVVCATFLYGLTGGSDR